MLRSTPRIDCARPNGIVQMTPLVSAVIPTRNRPHLVGRAVHSALNQTYACLEIIVVVDGPDSVTQDALAAIRDSRLRVIVLEKNVGVAEARNIGVRRANGDWIALLDDDDEWLPNKIARQIAELTSAAPGTNFTACRCREAIYTSLGPCRQTFQSLMRIGVSPFFVITGFVSRNRGWSQKTFCSLYLSKQVSTCART